MVPKGCARLICFPGCCRQRGPGPGLYSPWISTRFQATVQTKGPLVVIWAMDIYTEPCCCMVTDLDMAFSGSIGWNHHSLRWLPRLLPWLLLSNPKSPDPPLFIVIQLSHFSFCPIPPPHTCTSRWLMLQVGHTQGKASGLSIFLPMQSSQRK